MTENKTDTQNANGGMTEEIATQFMLQKLYVKDLSFEAPNSPGLFANQTGEPQIQMNLKNRHQRIEGDDYEVSLTVSVHATLEERTLYMIEVDQAGIFTIQGYADDELKRLAGTYCPATLFPYARETIASTVSKGGLPPLTLQPINFDALFAQASEETAQ